MLGQYAILWAMSNPDKVNKLIVLNTPLGRKTKLRPELAAYKAKMAFMRPDPNVSPPCYTSTCRRQTVYFVAIPCCNTWPACFPESACISVWTLLSLQKKAFDGATFNAAGGAYAMQGNIAAGYDYPYQEPGPGSVAIAETMKQVHI